MCELLCRLEKDKINSINFWSLLACLFCGKRQDGDGESGGNNVHCISMSVGLLSKMKYKHAPDYFTLAASAFCTDRLYMYLDTRLFLADTRSYRKMITSFP